MFVLQYLLHKRQHHKAALQNCFKELVIQNLQHKLHQELMKSSGIYNVTHIVPRGKKKSFSKNSGFFYIKTMEETTR